MSKRQQLDDAMAKAAAELAHAAMEQCDIDSTTAVREQEGIRTATEGIRAATEGNRSAGNKNSADLLSGIRVVSWVFF